MTDRLVLHIGTQKSGTTYLQRILTQLSGDLEHEGVLYPTRLGGRRSIHNHEAATYGLLGTAGFPWITATRASSQMAAWTLLRRAIDDGDGVAIVSAEALSVIDPPSVGRLVESFGMAHIDVIITARDLGRVFPSSWQQHIRNGHPDDLETYLHDHAQRRGMGDIHQLVRSWNADPDQTFWRAYALGGLVERWAPYARHVTVVTVPRRGTAPDELWRRFRRALDLGDILPTTPPPVDEIAANVGLTEPEILVLAALNQKLDADEAMSKEMRAVRSRIIREAFVGRSERGRPVRLPVAWVDRVAGWADTDLDHLRSTNAHVIGSESDLMVESAPEDAVEGPPAEEIAAAGGAALACLADLDHPDQAPT